jgi:mannose-6-phosphate isomerase
VYSRDAGDQRLETWGVVAEIWQHTDAAAPSDEHDIVRVADDYDRT